MGVQWRTAEQNTLAGCLNGAAPLLHVHSTHPHCPPGTKPLLLPMLMSFSGLMSAHSNVAIFWDYENCSPPSNSCGLGFDIVNNIRRIARLFGSVTAFRAYLDISAQSPKSVALRSELQSSGLSMIDCPHNGKKDVVDKMILVDMLAFAIDHPPPATIMLITGDRDYAYAVSILKLRRYQVILVVPSSPHVSPYLESQASLSIDWGAAILRNRTDPTCSTQAVRQPYSYLDLDANLVSQLLGELQDTSLDDLDTVLHPNPASSQATSGLRRISARDLLEPSMHPMDTESVDSTQECNQALSSPKKSTTTADDTVPTGFLIPRTPPRSRHASISLGSTRARSATIAAQSPPQFEQEIPAKNPPPTSTREIVDGLVQQTLPPSCDPFHANGSTGKIPVPVKLDTLPSHGLDRLASPFVMAKVQTGSDSVPDPSTSRTASAKTRTAALTTTYEAPRDIAVPREFGFLTGLNTKDNDEISERSVPYRVSPQGDARNVIDTPSSNHRSYFTSHAMRSPSPRSVELYLSDSDAPSDRRIFPPTMYLGVVDDDDSEQSAAPSRTSSALDRSVPDSSPARSSSGVSSIPPSTEEAHEQDESEWHQKWTMFKPLIHLLVAARERGITRPSRSMIATALVQSDKQAYLRAGVSRFRDYTTLAEQADVIELGGSQADAWIALHPDWLGVDDVATVHVPTSRVSSPMPGLPGVIANTSLTSSNNPSLESAANFQSLIAPSPLPRPPESGGAVPTLGTDRQENPFRAFVPVQFQPLIGTLVRMRMEGSPQALRSVVGQSLGQDVYVRAGVTGFKEYIHQASEAQLIQCGGVGGRAWIRLRPELRI